MDRYDAARLRRMIHALDARSGWRDSWCPHVALVDGWSCERVGPGLYAVATPTRLVRDVTPRRMAGVLRQGWRAAARSLLDRHHAARRAVEAGRRRDRSAEKHECAQCGATCAGSLCGTCSRWEASIPAWLETQPRGLGPVSLWVRWRAAHPLADTDRRRFTRALARLMPVDLEGYGINENGNWLDVQGHRFAGEVSL